MPFKKGESGNPSGRPKNPFRQDLAKGLLERLPKVFENLDMLEGDKYIAAYTSLAGFAYHRLASVKVDDEEGNQGLKIIIEDVSARSKD